MAAPEPQVALTHDEAYNMLVETWQNMSQVGQSLDAGVKYCEEYTPVLAEHIENAQLRLCAENVTFYTQELENGLSSLNFALQQVGELTTWAEWADAEIQKKDTEIERGKAEAAAASADRAAPAATSALSDTATLKALNDLAVTKAELDAANSALAVANAELDTLRAAAEADATAAPRASDSEALRSKLTSTEDELKQYKDIENVLKDKIAELEGRLMSMSEALDVAKDDAKLASAKQASVVEAPNLVVLQNTIRRLQRDLEAARIRERDTQDLLESEHRKQLTLQETLQETLSAQASPSRKSPSKQRPMTAPQLEHLDVLKTMRRNQSLINDITSQRYENDRLRSDNASLLLHAKDANTSQATLHNAVSTSYADRAELRRRLHKADSEKKMWEAQLTKTAARTIRRHQVLREAEEQYQWQQIELTQVRSGSAKHKFTKHTGMPPTTRNIQVHKWAGMNSLD